MPSMFFKTRQGTYDPTILFQAEWKKWSQKDLQENVHSSFCSYQKFGSGQVSIKRRMDKTMTQPHNEILFSNKNQHVIDIDNSLAVCLKKPDIKGCKLWFTYIQFEKQEIYN